MSKTDKKPKSKAETKRFEIAQLAAAIQQVGRLTGTDMINMRLERQRLRVGGENAGRSFAAFLDYPGNGSWEFAISKAVLDQTLKGRKDLDMTVADGRLHFKARSFHADFATEPYNAGPELQKDSDVLQINAEQQRRLLESMRLVYMTSTFSADTLFCVDMDAKRSYVACLDTMNAAVLKGEGVKTPLNFSMPSSSFKTLLEMAGDTDYKLSVTGAALCAWSDEWEMTLPFVQTENEFDLVTARKMVGGLGKSFARCRSVDLANALQAANTVLEVGADIDVEVSEKSIRVTGSSAMGRVTEEIVAKMLLKNIEPFKIDGSSAIHLLNIAPGEFVEIGVDHNAFFIRAHDETTQATYVTALRSGS